MEKLNKLSLPLGLKTKNYKKKEVTNETQKGGNNKFQFTNNIVNKQTKVDNFVDFDLPLSKEPSKIDSYMIKDIYMI